MSGNLNQIILERIGYHARRVFGAGFFENTQSVALDSAGAKKNLFADFGG